MTSGYTAPAMFDRLRRCRLAAWLAFTAIAAVALMPTVASALARSGGVTEVCTPAGMKLVALGSGQAGDQPQPAGAALHLNHCAFCGGAFGALGMPPAPLALPLPASVPVRAVAERPVRPALRPAWPMARPRGPPPSA
jgi:hypothetical protein